MNKTFVCGTKQVTKPFSKEIILRTQNLNTLLVVDVFLYNNVYPKHTHMFTRWEVSTLWQRQATAVADHKQVILLNYDELGWDRNI